MITTIIKPGGDATIARKSFFFYPNGLEPWLDVCFLLDNWLKISNIKHGFLFRPFSSGFDRFDIMKNDKMVRKSLNLGKLQWSRNYRGY